MSRMWTTCLPAQVRPAQNSHAKGKNTGPGERGSTWAVSVGDEGTVFPGTEDVLRRPADVVETSRANRSWWDWHADDYLAELGDELGAATFQWGPEGVQEDDARLLGDV